VAQVPTFIGHPHLSDIPDAAGVHPIVFQAMTSGLLTAEYQLAVSFFDSARTVQNISEADLLIVCAPGV
jgi:hypothetical protein